MKLPGFVGGSYESQEKFLAGERTINLYPRLIAREAAKAKAVLVPVPGLSAFATAHAWGGRGLFADRGRLFGVYGGILDEIEEDGVVTQRGLVDADSHPASVSTNGDGGDELFIVSGDTGYILDLPTNVLTAVGAVAGGPIGAAVGAVANAVLKKPLAEMGAKTYRVTGPWKSPKVEVVGREQSRVRQNDRADSAGAP